VVYVTDKGILQGTVPCLEDVEVRSRGKFGMLTAEYDVFVSCFVLCFG